MKLTLLASLLAFSCNTATVHQPIELTLTTDGGFSGRGLGSVTIRGDSITAGTIGSESCTGTLADDEREQLGSIAGKASLEEWRSDYTPADNPHGSADQVRYTLTLNGRRVTWTDEAESSLPPALASLRNLAWKLRESACRK